MTFGNKRRDRHGSNESRSVTLPASPALEHLLAHLYAVPGVRGPRSNIALRTHLERGTPAAIGLDGRDAFEVPTPLASDPVVAGG